MGERRLGDVPVDVLAGAATLCMILTQRLSSIQSELCSEILCWVTLPILLRVTGGSNVRTSRTIFLNGPEARPASRGKVWTVATAVVLACLCKAERRVVGFYPALGPVLFIAQEHLRPEFHSLAVRGPSFFSPGPSFFSPIVNTLWGTSLVASFNLLALPGWCLGEPALQTVSLVALSLVYIALLPGGTASTGYSPSVNLDSAVIPLSVRVVFLLVIALGVETHVYGFPRSETVPTLLLGLAKASSWYFITRTTQYTTWCVAAAAGTFSIVATSAASGLTSEFEALAHVASSFFSLGQLVQTMPAKATAKRGALWLLMLFPLIPCLTDLSATMLARSATPFGPDDARDHPVEALARGAEADIENRLSRQSRSYVAAHNEYRRRYRMDPPPGFQAWYEFARSRQSPIIDDFDSIYDAVSPFWAISGPQVRQMMSKAQSEPGSELWLCEVSTGRGNTHCRHPYRTYDRHISRLFDRLLTEVGGAVPEVSFLVNHLDEPRVLLPPRPSTKPPVATEERLSQTSMSHRSVWDAITRFCASRGARKPAEDTQDDAASANTVGLPFVANVSSAMDLCQHPEYSNMHGLFMSPTSFVLIEGMVPILSTGSPSTMGDILFPSPAYTENEFRYISRHDVDWDKKRNNLYWAGSNTGGFASDDQWRSYHRQRFVKLAQNLEKQQHYYLREKRDGVVTRVALSFLNSRLFDVAFTRIFQCERRLCRDQRDYFNVKRWVDGDRAFQSRLVFDLDGNGISGRYYKLLASKSVPLKQTLLREWHDDRLMPWVHYIPVSQSMEELPELVTYLTLTESGQRRARRIAEQGRQWFTRALREDDMSIYTYRLLLELARLQDPGREAR